MEVFLVSHGFLLLRASLEYLTVCLLGGSPELWATLLLMLPCHDAQGDGLEAGDVEALAESVASRIDVLVRLRSHEIARSGHP